MKIGLVGPTHPYKGGIAQHTTALAHRLEAMGHDVRVISWERQYPVLLYPGQQTVDRPELPEPQHVDRLLAWNRPDSWWRAGRRLRRVDLVILVHVIPAQALAYRALLAGVGRGRPPVVALCHNVLPHERGRFDARLVRMLFSQVDRLLVHAEAEAQRAVGLTDVPVSVADLPPHAPVSAGRFAPLPGVHRRVLFFGLVREYKGVDLLVRAIARGPDGISLRVAGEFWGNQLSELTKLRRELGITDRVELRSGYVSADDVPALFRDVDVQVLPYRTASASQGVLTAFRLGVPVIATRVGNLADRVAVGVNGLVVEPDSVESLAAALEDFYRPGVPERMREGVRPVDDGDLWERYLEALLESFDRGIS